MGFSKEIMKLNKNSGRGTVVHKKPINDTDLKKIFNFFKDNMAKEPNARNLQEIMLFLHHILYW